MGILHDDEEDLRAELHTAINNMLAAMKARGASEFAANQLRAELADVKAELQRWHRITAMPGHEAKALTPEAVAENLTALLADVEWLTAERDEAIADRDRYLTRACVAEAKVAKVRAVAISEQGPFLDRSEPSENENYNCGKWDAARAILAAIEGPNVCPA